MKHHIQVETLREWLDRACPVTVVDVRSDDDRAQWAIPGSVHVNAYDALREGRAGPLATFSPPTDRPVVTVCGAGRTSEVAADLLTARGFETYSLVGGMKAWSTAWNVAEVPITDRSVEIVQIRRTGKGCLSYLVASGNDAAVIDPSVSATVYTQIADGHGWQIKHVIETHIHADHLSRARRLAEQTAAQLLLPVQQRVHFRFTPIRAGESIAIGRATLRVFATPGHTDESLSFLLNDAALFSGDTLFPNGVGRPDLHADARQARRKAAALFSSLIQLSALPRTALLLAAHASEPIAFDGRPIAATIGDIQSWLHEWLTNENAFVDRVTSHLPPAPANFATIIEFNEGGEWPAGAEGDLEAGANRCAVS